MPSKSTPKPRNPTIHLTYVANVGEEKTYRYSDIKWARQRAHKLVTASPREDIDGYAVHPVHGGCLFFRGTTFQELFPAGKPVLPKL